MQFSSPVARAVRVLGVDDWSWKKGRRYGTILVDLERHKIIDLLPDRDKKRLLTGYGFIQRLTLSAVIGEPITLPLREKQLPRQGK
ncbi:transposase [Ktedonobacter racemifer]|uniref:transposase n=1 Tax=Ktedonobacter racemifer TaxID=363277 RepID=UPI003B75B6AA